jgi:hypothetical protein
MPRKKSPKAKIGLPPESEGDIREEGFRVDTSKKRSPLGAMAKAGQGHLPAKDSLNV